MSPKRKYDSSAQTELKTLTHKKVINAAFSLFMDQWIDEITLRDVANKAEVTVQTVIRHFGSREQLLLTAVEEIDLGADLYRGAPGDGDLRKIVVALVDYYEQYGKLILRCLAQENRIPQLDITLSTGRRQHRAWVRKVFSPYLSRVTFSQRSFLEDQLYAICEIYLWRVYRIDLGQTRTVLEEVWLFQLQQLLNAYMKSG